LHTIGITAFHWEKTTFSLIFPQNKDLLVNFFTSNFRFIITHAITNISLVFST
jgi:hypothetical protein